MPANSFFRSERTHTGAAVLLIGLVIVFLFRIEDPYHFALLFSTFFMAIVRPFPFKQWTRIDICLGLITVYDLASCPYAEYSAPAIRHASVSLHCFVAYLISRRLFTSARAGQILLQGSCLPVGAALFLAGCSFFIFRQSVWTAGFQDTYHLRFLFRPLGYITNVWAEILLVLLGWVCLIRRCSNLFVFAVTGAILLSFSRGAYIAWGAYLIVWMLSVTPAREKWRLPAIGLIAVVLTGIFFQREMKTTLQMNRTVSQQRSTEGRITATQAGWNAFVRRPIQGYGNGNYAHAADRWLNQDSTMPYTSFAPNILIRLLTEKGIAGSLLFLILAVAVVRSLLKHPERQENRIIGCTFVAITVKEMTQATLFDTPFALLMLYIMLAYLQKEETCGEEEQPRPLWANSQLTIPVVLSALYLVQLQFDLRRKENNRYLQESGEVWKEGKYTEAIRRTERTEKQTSGLINRGMIYMQYYRTTKKNEYLQKASEAFREAHRKHPDDVEVRYLSMRLYTHARMPERALPVARELATNYPKHSLYLAALSDVLYQQNQKEAALQPLTEAIRYTPRLLTGQRIRELKRHDRKFYDALLQQLCALTPADGDSPADYARYGYIARWCGNRALSDKYLRIAVERLPNLATPWHLLGDDDKYRLLIYGAFRKKQPTTDFFENKEITDWELFVRSYRHKFESRYGCLLTDIGTR